MIFEIKHKFSGAVLFALETKSLKLCVQAAVEQEVSLSEAYLSGAYLSGAYLSGADLRGAYLSGAYLSGAYLSGADLSGADLSGADLRGADLSGADLSGAYLSGAYLSGADLRGAYLSGADLSGADLRGADLSGADLSGAKWDISPASDEQAVKNLDQVAAIILDDVKRLDMSIWHYSESEWEKHTCAEEAVCGTTHCLAGWLQVCSTDEKIRKLDPAIAGTLLAPVAARMFYASNSEVIDWLKNREYAQVNAEREGK